jgi:hypothetical protein
MSRRAHFVLIGIGVMAMAVASAQQPQPRPRTEGQTVTDPVRIDGERTLVVEPAAKGPRYLIYGELQSGSARSGESENRVSIPLDQIRSVVVYRAVPVWRCTGPKCLPCEPDKACLGPPPPPPPIRDGSKYAALVRPRDERTP